MEMDATKPQQEEERKDSTEMKTVKAFSSEEEAESLSEEDAGEPVQNHRGWKAMPYVIGELSPSRPSTTSCLSLLSLATTMSTENQCTRPKSITEAVIWIAISITHVQFCSCESQIGRAHV